MSDAGRINIYVAEEPTWGGSVSALAPATLANVVSESLATSTATQRTNALRGDYVKPHAHRTRADGQGDLGYELAYGDVLDTFGPGAARSAWTAAITTTASLSAVASGNKISRAAGSFVTDGWVVGQWARISGFVTNPTNNGVARVTAVAALDLTFEGITFINEGPLAIVVKTSGMLRNGTTTRSFCIERKFGDLTNKWIYMCGARVSAMKLTSEVEGLVGGSVSFMGKPQQRATATRGNGSFGAPTTTRVMGAVDALTGLAEGGTLVTTLCSSVSLDIMCPGRPIHAFGSIGPSAIGSNSFEVSGSFRVFWDDAADALYAKRLDHTSSKLWWRYNDAAGNTIVVTVPALKFGGGDPNGSGPDTDTVLELTYMAELDPVTNCLFQFDRILA